MKPMGIIAAAASLMFASAAVAGNAPPPLDRPAAILRSQSFHDQIGAALTQPMHELYVKAQAGVTDDAWVYGLALFATRSNRDDVP